MIIIKSILKNPSDPKIIPKRMKKSNDGSPKRCVRRLSKIQIIKINAQTSNAKSICSPLFPYILEYAKT